MTDDRTEILSAVMRMRNTQFADLVTLVIGLAAETHPEALRTALGKVFDLSAVEETAKRSVTLLASIQNEAMKASDEIRYLFATVGEVRLETEKLHARLSKAAQLMKDANLVPKESTNGEAANDGGERAGEKAPQEAGGDGPGHVGAGSSGSDAQRA